MTDVQLVIDSHGIGVTRSPTDTPRVLPWASVARISVTDYVDPGQSPASCLESATSVTRGASPRAAGAGETGTGAQVVIETAESTYRFLVPGSDAGALRATLEGLGRPYGASYTGTSGTIPGDRSEGTFERIRPVIIVVLVIAVAAMVAVILAQSAGALHLSFLDGAATPAHLGT